MTSWRNPLMARLLKSDDPTQPAVSSLTRLDAGDIEARESCILGRPPRISPLPPQERSPEAMAVVTHIRRAVGAGDTDEMPEFFATMLHHPALMEKQAALSAQFHHGFLSPRDRQLAILRTAW